MSPAKLIQLKNDNRNIAVSLIPNSITILAICCGLTAVRFALEQRYGISLIFIAAAAIMDALDGRTARLLNASSEIGVQIDSLADAINFGVAPALITYLAFSSQHLSWVFALVFTVCVVLRLARFNIIAESSTTLEYEKDFFVGVPAPAGALLSLLPVGLLVQFSNGWWTNRTLVAIWILLISALLISRIPTYSFKTIRISPKYIPLLLIVVCLTAGIALTSPLILFFILDFLYILHIPWAWNNRRWIIKRPDTWNYKKSERNEIRKNSRKYRYGKSNSRLWLKPPRR